MPYHLEKGPIFTALDAVYNDPVGLPRFLLKLWSGGEASLGQLGVLASKAIDNPDKSQPNAEGKDRLKSLSQHWFGEDEHGHRQPEYGFDPTTGVLTTQTGYWIGYYGKVREILAETLTRAAEVALGIDRPDPLPPQPPIGTRRWAVEFYWKCGQPRFEGWVTWRRHGNGPDGQVTVILATPPTPSLVLSKPGGPDHNGKQTATPVTSSATTSSAWQGSMVSAQTEHVQHPILTWLPTAQAAWGVPPSGIITEGRGAVGTWSPNWHHGGAPEQPLSYQTLNPTI